MEEEPNIIYARRLFEIADRLLQIMEDTARLKISPGELSVLVYAESECLRELAEELSG